jgi:hypothetical protein
LRSSSKFIQPETIKYWEEQKNKQKWLNKNGFRSNIRKYLNKKFEIPNYVRQSEGTSPHSYNFREVNKEKFIGKSDFKYVKAHDCLF